MEFNESSSQWLPTFPPVAMRILEVFSNDEVAITELAEAIKNDPALTANILKVANSPVYRAGKRNLHAGTCDILVGS